MEYWAGSLVALVGIIIFQQVYWAVVVNKLINKLMSRDYGFYHSQNKEMPKVTRMPLPESPDLDFGTLSEVGRI